MTRNKPGAGDFANHYGCLVFPAMVKAPRINGAENLVKLVYQRI